MNPILALLFVIGLWELLKAAWHDVRAASKGNSNAAARSTPRAKNAASRQAQAGWWGREARHGFPVTRAGLRHGWQDHRDALAARQHKLSGQAADHAEHRAGWAEEAADHRRRMAAARARIDQADQPAPATRPASPPAGSQPANGHRRPAASPAPATRPVTTGGTVTATEITYEQTLGYAQQAKTQAEAAVNDATLAEAQQMCDQLGVALNDDRQGIAMAGELAAAIKMVIDAAKLMQERAAALEDHITKTHGPVHEAATAAGAMAETGFHGH